jgi:hypothetical protein
MTMFAEPLLAGGEERYGEREYQQQQQQQQHQQYNSHVEKGGRLPYQETEAEDREVIVKLLSECWSYLFSTVHNMDVAYIG